MRDRPSLSTNSRLSRDSCRCRFSSRLSSLASINSCTKAAAVKPTDIPRWQAASPSPRATWVLPAPLLPTAMMKELHRPPGHRAPELKSAPGDQPRADLI